MSDELNEAPIPSPEEQHIRKAIAEIQKMADRVEFLARTNGRLFQAIKAHGGDPSYLKDLTTSAADLYRASEEVEYGALAHNTSESVEVEEVAELNEATLERVKRLAGL